MASQVPSVVERFHALFSTELGWMWSTLARLGVPASDLEDVAHEVFLQVYRKFESYDPARPTRPWLFAFAYRAASDYRRLARHRREEPTSDPPHPVHDDRTDDVLARSEEEAMVRAALQTVDFDRRAVLIAFEVDGTPMKDVADMLGIPLHTAYSRLRVGREELAAEIRRRRARQRHAVAWKEDT